MADCPQCARMRPDDASACPHCGATSPLPDDLIGREVLGRYRITRLLAEGGMGRVYVAEQAVGTALRRVAVKIVRPQRGADPQLVSRFAREAETLVKLTHPNTVQLFDFGALADGTLALAMEYVQGRSLARMLAEGKLDPERAERILAQICGALAEAHAAGIVHRDLKPDNVLVVQRGADDFVKVVDFGIAKVAGDGEAASQPLTQHGMMIGTPPYMSPEQFSGSLVDARSDIYALGLIAYEMLTGDLPFSAKTPWEWASKHLTAEPRPLEGCGLAAHHAAAIRCALAKHAAERPESASAFLAMFTGRAPAHTVPASVSATQGAPLVESVALPRASARHTVGYALLGGALALAGLLVARATLGTRTQTALPALPAAVTTPALAPAIDASPRDDLVTGATGQAAEQPEPVIRDAAAHPPGRGRRARTGGVVTAPAGALGPVPPAEALPVEAPEPPTTAAAIPPPSPAPAPTEAPRAPAPSPPQPDVTEPAEAATSGDLRTRIDRIRAALPERVELAIGLYQAAAAQHRDAPALAPVREALAASGATRARMLGDAGRCAQAAALLRALRSIGAAPSEPGRVGRCPPP